MRVGSCQNRDSVKAANNNSGLSVTLDTEGRNILEGYVTVSNTATIKVYGSIDNENWRLTDTTSTNNTKHLYYFNAFRFVKIEVPTTGIDITIEITAQ
ncbi:MAG: hypothetical protein ACTSVX_05965 [Promethearchaeota archaeon]